ncbi:alpha/beta fold hydrolase [Pontixanthobacter sp. CEM42]|uniref:S9 family peptidase n=1 Tax=Pontixanthobacter sp. CEM42 TaxID=2792077 RepID=UPI001AE02232|nr:alpha/beta fold hydrolase [Pontixanthobacter sp. CEM42]
MKTTWRCVLCFAAFVLGTAVSAQDATPAQTQQATESLTAGLPERVPTAAFAERNQLRSARISPDGKWIAMRMTLDDRPNLALFNADTKKPYRRIAMPEDVELKWFRWAGPKRVLFAVSSSTGLEGRKRRFSRLYSLDTDTGERLFIGRNGQGLYGDDLIHVAPDGSFVLLAIQKNIYNWPQVMRFPLDRKSNGENVQGQKRNVLDWWADNEGVVRVGGGWVNNRYRVYYRSSEDDGFDQIGKLAADSAEMESWQVSSLTAGSDIGYVIQKTDSGRKALLRYNYATQEVVDTVYENPQWDVNDAYFDRDNTPIAVSYTAEADEIEWLDPDLATLQGKMSSALPEGNARIVSRADDGSRMLIWAGNAGDPGAMYIFTPATKKVDLFLEMRPQVDFRQLVMPKAISYTARDGTEINGFLTLPKGREAKGLPLVILPHGGPYGIRDTLRYDDEVQLMANRGYAVLQPNYRGSGGYGDAFEELGDGQIGRGMQDDLDDAMDWAVAEGIADPKRVCVVGSSYGGYAAMWAVLRNPERYRCAASFAGVSDWRSLLLYDRDYFSTKFYREWRDRVEGNDEDITLNEVSPYRSAENLTRPLLLAHGKKDSRVPFDQFEKMRDAAQSTGQLELLVFEDEGHSFDKKESEQAWYDKLEAFLAKHNPAD